MIEAVIFDMDGVIIDSEPLWVEAQKEVFLSIGVDYKEELAVNTVGVGTYDTIDFWYRYSPWKDITYKEIEERIMGRMAILIEQKGQAIDGLFEILDFLKAKGLKLGLASGSPPSAIEQVIRKFNIGHYFKAVLSAKSEEFGKPHPGIFLSAARQLKVLPLNCMVIEDSFNGLIAAKAARMKAVGLLRNGDFDKNRFAFADLRIQSFRDFSETQYNYLQNLI